MLHRLKLLHPGHYVFALLILLGAIIPDQMATMFSSVTTWFAEYFGWLVLLICAAFVVLCAVLAFGRYSHVRLGGADERPQFSTISWFAMLFAAGMGSGLVFYGAAEPLTHYMNPAPGGEFVGDNASRAREAMALSFFHWGIHAWAIYAVAALSIAFFSFHRQLPMLPASPMHAYLTPQRRRLIAPLVNMAGIIGVVFGLVASLSMAILQLSEGIVRVFDPQAEMITIRLAILAAMFVCYTASASSGLGKGIKILSDVNMVVAVLLMAFVISFGPTLFIFETFVSGIGDYLNRFIALSFDARQLSDNSGWTSGWTITYFLWWISWGPFVGVFIARISRGRTLREFLLGVILAPTIFSALWFSALGGTALHLELISEPGFAANISNIQATTFEMMDRLPLETITPVVILFLLFIFLITSADSGSYVLGMFTSDGDMDPPIWQRVSWGVLIGLVTAGALMSGKGADFFRAFAVIGAIPYLLVMCWQSRCLFRALKEDRSSD